MDEQYSEQTSHVVPAEEMMIFLRDLETLRSTKRMNFYNHHIRSIFKSHSISITFKFCAVRVALCALEPRSTDSLGTQHQNLNVTLIE